MNTERTTENNEPATLTAVGSNDVVRPGAEALPMMEPAGFRTRYRSEPGMIGHYPWTYADQGRRRVDRPEHETEDLFTEDQVRSMLAAERERCALIAERGDEGDWSRSTGDYDAQRGVDIARVIRIGPNVEVTGPRRR